MADVGDGLGYVPLDMEKRSSKKLDRVKEILTEKFNYLRDSVKNHKRQTVYVVATLASIAILGEFGLPIVGGSCLAHNEFQEAKKERIAYKNCTKYTSRNQDV